MNWEVRQTINVTWEIDSKIGTSTRKLVEGWTGKHQHAESESKGIRRTRTWNAMILQQKWYLSLERVLELVWTFRIVFDWDKEAVPLYTLSLPSHWTIIGFCLSPGWTPGTWEECLGPEIVLSLFCRIPGRTQELDLEVWAGCLVSLCISSLNWTLKLNLSTWCGEGEIDFF